MTIWSFLWFCLQWNLLLILVAVVSLVLAQTDYPFLALLPLVLCGVLFWRDAARVRRTMHGRIIRRFGGEIATAGSRRVASRRAFTGRASSTRGFAARSIQPAEAEHPRRAFRAIMR